MCTGRFSFYLKCVLTSRIVFSLNLVPLHIQQCLKHSDVVCLFEETRLRCVIYFFPEGLKNVAYVVFPDCWFKGGFA